MEREPRGVAGGVGQLEPQDVGLRVVPPQRRRRVIGPRVLRVEVRHWWSCYLLVSARLQSNAPLLIISATRGGVSLAGSASSTISASKISSGSAS